MDALNKCVEAGTKQNGLLSGSRFYRVLKFCTSAMDLFDVRLDKPQEFIQVGDAAVRISAVSSSFASPIALVRH